MPAPNPFRSLPRMIVTLVLGLGGSLLVVAALSPPVNGLEISDDTAFRRAVRESSAVFAFQREDRAVDHWIALWTISEQLDETTRRDRRCLLVAAAETVLARAATREEVAWRLRSHLSEELRAGRIHWEAGRNRPVLAGSPQEEAR